MDLSSFAFVHWSYYERIREASNCGQTTDKIRETIENDFRIAYETDKIGYSGVRKINTYASQAEIAWLRTTYKNTDGDWLWLKFEKNTKQNAQEWFAQICCPKRMYTVSSYAPNSM